MKIFNKKFKKGLLLIIFLIITMPLIAFFCYNLGKYSNFSDTLEGTFNQYLPVSPVFIVAGIILAWRLAKKRD
jgi:hypothetical protein